MLSFTDVYPLQYGASAAVGNGGGGLGGGVGGSGGGFGGGFGGGGTGGLGGGGSGGRGGEGGGSGGGLGGDGLGGGAAVIPMFEGTICVCKHTRELLLAVQAGIPSGNWYTNQLYPNRES